MYVADCLYMGSEVSIIAKSELVLKTLISSVGDERGNGDIDVLDIVTDKDFQPVVHGGWVGDEDYEHMYGYYEAYKCSSCGCGVGYTSKYPYCPECGAKMWNGVTEEERMRY